MKKGRFICYLLLAVAAVGLGRSTPTYLATCVTCLQLARIAEKSILGITYSRTEELRPHAGTIYDSVTNSRVIAPLDPKLYREITGHRCEHTFVRDKFRRNYYFRKELVENLYRGYLCVPDQALARETAEMIDQLYPFNLARYPTAPRIRPPMQYAVEAQSLPDEPLSILYRGLGLMRSSAEWRQVLDAARAGNGSLTLFVDPDILVRRLDNPDPAVRFQIIDQLAALSDPRAWTAIAGCLKDPHLRTRASERIVFSGHLEFFEAVFKADEETRAREHVKEDDPVGYTQQIFDHLLVKYSAEEIRNLFALNRPHLDRLGFAAIAT